MRVFGPPWDAPAYDEGEKVATPVGQDCADCAVPIIDGDRGLVIPHVDAERTGSMRPWHLLCFLRSVIGEVVIDESQPVARIRPALLRGGSED